MSASSLSKKQYPPQTGHYKIVVKSGDDWRLFDHARFPISVGQDYHEGDKLKDTFSWASVRFKRNSVMLADTLQRLNLQAQLGLDENAAERKAYAMGNEWLRRNSEMIRMLNGLDITRWNDWRYHPGFNDAMQATKNAYEGDAGFRGIVDATANRICEKMNSVSLFNSSRSYLLEETAVTAVFSDSKIIDLYPGTNFKGFDYLRDTCPEGLTNYKNWRSARIHHLTR